MVSSLIQKKRIKVKFDYNEAIIDRLKQSFIKATYNAEQVVWSMPNCPFNLERLKQLKLDFGEIEWKDSIEFKDVESIGLPHIEAVDVIREEINNSDKYKMTPKEYQYTGITYMIEHQTCINGDDMGLGKTGQTICATEILESFPVLVITPSSVKYNWEKEWNKWIHNPEVSVIDGKDLNFDSPIVIINYDILDKHKKELLKRDWSCLIVDECHMAKNSKTKRTKVINNLSKHIEVKYLLSGTPVENKPSELISMFNILGVFEKLFNNWKSFIYKFCDAHSNGFGLDFSGSSNEFLLNKIMRENCYIRREKSSVSNELGKVEPQNIIVKANNHPKFRRMQKDFIAYLEKEYDEDKVEAALEAPHLVMISEMKKLSIEGKMKQVFEWIDNFLESTDRKLLIFSTNTMPLDAIVEKYGALKINGSVGAKKKFDLVEEFQNSDNRILAGNIISMGTGTDGLQNVCSDGLFLQFPDKPSIYDQAVSRLDRTGQKEPVMITNILSDLGVDEMMWQVLLEKYEITDAINKGKRVDRNVESMDIELIKRMKLNNNGSKSKRIK